MPLHESICMYIRNDIFLAFMILFCSVGYRKWGSSLSSVFKFILHWVCVWLYEGSCENWISANENLFLLLSLRQKKNYLLFMYWSFNLYNLCAFYFQTDRQPVIFAEIDNWLVSGRLTVQELGTGAHRTTLQSRRFSSGRVWASSCLPWWKLIQTLLLKEVEIFWPWKWSDTSHKHWGKYCN